MFRWDAVDVYTHIMIFYWIFTLRCRQADIVSIVSLLGSITPAINHRWPVQWLLIVHPFLPSKDLSLVSWNWWKSTVSTTLVLIQNVDLLIVLLCKVGKTLTVLNFNKELSKSKKSINFSPEATTPAINTQLWIFPQISIKMRNGPNRKLSGRGGTDLWKKPESKISCQTPLKGQ